MARFNEILVGRVNRGLQKWGGIKGTVPVPALNDELQPVLIVDDMTAVENRGTGQFDRFAMSTTQTGGAAQVAAVKMRNPTGSNLLAIFEKIWVGGNAADLINLQYQIADTGDYTLVPGGWGVLDSRPGVRHNPTIVMSQTTNGANFTFFASFNARLVAGTNYDFVQTPNHEIPLFPGSQIQLISTTVTNRIDVGFVWRERLLEDSEKF